MDFNLGKACYQILLFIGLCIQGFALNCGTRPLEQFLSRTPFIVGGRSARFGELPWQVGLFYNGNYFCGGALIASKWVLTAGHCAKTPPDLSKLAIRLGEYDLTSDYPKRHIQVGVESRIVHEDFSYESVPIFDVALLKLDKEVRFEENIQPVCIPDQDVNFIDKMGTIGGWGRTSYNGLLPNVLQIVDLKIVNSETCQEWLREKHQPTILRKDWICAGFKEGGKDACQGDSGSPLVIKDNKKYVVVGLSSSGFDCGKPKLLGIYTNVSMFTNWIIANMQETPSNTVDTVSNSAQNV